MPNLAKSLIKNLKSIMAEKGMSQAELSRASGIAQPHISAYLSGKNHPGLDNLEALAKGLGVSASALFGDEAPESAPPRKPTPEEMAEAVLSALGVNEMRMRLIRAVLRVPDDIVPQLGVTLKTLESLVPSAPAANKTKRSTG